MYSYTGSLAPIVLLHLLLVLRWSLFPPPTAGSLATVPQCLIIHTLMKCPSLWEINVRDPIRALKELTV